MSVSFESSTFHVNRLKLFITFLATTGLFVWGIIVIVELIRNFSWNAFFGGLFILPLAAISVPHLKPALFDLLYGVTVKLNGENLVIVRKNLTIHLHFSDITEVYRPLLSGENFESLILSTSNHGEIAFPPVKDSQSLIKHILCSRFNDEYKPPVKPIRWQSILFAYYLLLVMIYIALLLF